jgi:hypothetical protein
VLWTLLGPGLLILSGALTVIIKIPYLSCVAFGGAIFGLLSMFVWLGILRDILQAWRAARRMSRSLRNGAEDLAWVYALMARKGRAIEKYTFEYRFTDKRGGRLSGSPQLIQELLHFFWENYPQVSIGYIPDLETRFRKSPQSLKTLPAHHQDAKIVDAPINNVDIFP